MPWVNMMFLLCAPRNLDMRIQMLRTVLSLEDMRLCVCQTENLEQRRTRHVMLHHRCSAWAASDQIICVVKVRTGQAFGGRFYYFEEGAAKPKME